MLINDISEFVIKRMTGEFHVLPNASDENLIFSDKFKQLSRPDQIAVKGRALEYLQEGKIQLGKALGKFG